MFCPGEGVNGDASVQPDAAIAVATSRANEGLIQLPLSNDKIDQQPT
jgi:hypothetical protein